MTIINGKTGEEINDTIDPLFGMATVLSRPTGHYLIDGRTGRTLRRSSTGQALVVYKYANARRLKLVNETSQLGQAIIARIHSDATARLPMV